VETCSAKRLPVDVIVEAIEGHEQVLLAIDAPLGWPQDLGAQIARHYAGKPLDVEANDFFRRQTDKFVKARIGQQPLDIGADRIARTALSALKLLGAVEARTGMKIGLAWAAEPPTALKAIEVYPAATLRAHRLQNSGYKKPEDLEARSAILAELAERMAVECPADLLVANADALDAVVCVLAGADFLRGESLGPRDAKAAEKEGWIWVRDPACHEYNQSLETDG
jgi:hypothetical protein